MIKISNLFLNQYKLQKKNVWNLKCQISYINWIRTRFGSNDLNLIVNEDVHWKWDSNFQDKS